MINIYTTIHSDILRVHYQSKYASGSVPVKTPQELVSAIEEVCGKGSYCLYHRPKDFPIGSAEVVDYSEARYKHAYVPRLTYWQQGVKTGVIEQAREEAIKLWGNIPEMEVGWLENMCRSYVN